MAYNPFAPYPGMGQVQYPSWGGAVPGAMPYTQYQTQPYGGWQQQALAGAWPPPGFGAMPMPGYAPWQQQGFGGFPAGIGRTPGAPIDGEFRSKKRK